MFGIIVSFVVAIALSVPFIWIARSDRKLTWTWAVVLGSVLGSISLILIGDIPSRILYLFDQEHNKWAEAAPFLAFLAEDRPYRAARDLVANAIQTGLFVVLMVIPYFWGESRRKSGRFKS